MNASPAAAAPGCACAWIGAAVRARVRGLAGCRPGIRTFLVAAFAVLEVLAVFAFLAVMDSVAS
jgi:hypothetical protein